MCWRTIQQIKALLNAGTIELIINGTISLDTLIDRDNLTDEQGTALDQFLPLLQAKDEGVIALLRDAQVLELLKGFRRDSRTEDAFGS